MFRVLLALLLPCAVLSRPVNDFQTPFTFEQPASLPVSNPTKSFWLDTPGANLLANEGSTGPLTEDADVCIIGSGMTGVSAAFHLAQAVKTINSKDSSLHLKAVVLEAREFCSGATGRNGGHLTPHSFFNYRSLERQWGKSEVIKSLELENRTTMAMVKIIEEYNLTDTVDLVSGGHLSLIGSTQEYASLTADYHAARQAGLDVGDVEWFSEAEVDSIYGASYPAVRFSAFNFWPSKFVTQLYLLANSSTPHFSLDLHTHTPVISIAPLPSSRWSLGTLRGSVHCTHVVHATNAYASHLLSQFSGRKGIIPTRGQMITLRSGTAINDSWRASWGGLDHHWFPRPLNGSDAGSPNNRPLVVLGGGREIGGPTNEQFQTDDSVLNAAVGEDLHAFLPNTFPRMFEEGEMPEMEWTGIMGYTETTDPFVGPVINDPPSNSDLNSQSGQYIAAGYNGHGMPRAYSCAEAVAGMVMAAVQGKAWTVPEWFPTHYLTRNRR
ncbi:hypothetical protein GYMLUDRAFT_45893 [Collybiopsis luxurians FD-317 M1]|uniref:FAD dependent oxidoreductase domain-containing protein n=1 Tax=Collybiopsis luxurians FD-317 M1 TaxID=944289 RepID=A0A0D0CHJ0_9AGAR|nr:hypothetical protein GYMLUDRAFT_45893 [Collybiopsis luxurians FD-317 M1]